MTELEKLWKKYLDQSATPEELSQLWTALRDSNQEPIFSKLLEKEWDNTASDQQSSQSIEETLLASIRGQLEEETPIIPLPFRKRFPIYRYASAALLAGIIGLFAWWLLSPISPETELVQLEVKTAEQAQSFPLPDGSTVWLNAATRLSYSKGFLTNRQVWLEGEALFEVAKDSLHPFVVQAGGISTRVLGTIFNVEAYGDFSKVEVALIEGKVAVEIPKQEDTLSILLQPSETIRVSKSKNDFQQGAFIENEPYLWKDGIINFNGTPVEEVIKTLEKHYDVKFEETNPKTMQSLLVYRLDKNQFTLEDALEHISITADYRFEWISKKRIKVLTK